MAKVFDLTARYYVRTDLVTECVVFFCHLSARNQVLRIIIMGPFFSLSPFLSFHLSFEVKKNMPEDDSTILIIAFNSSKFLLHWNSKTNSAFTREFDLRSRTNSRCGNLQLVYQWLDCKSKSILANFFFRNEIRLRSEISLSKRIFA